MHKLKPVPATAICGFTIVAPTVSLLIQPLRSVNVYVYIKLPMPGGVIIPLLVTPEPVQIPVPPIIAVSYTHLTLPTKRIV